MSLDVSLTVPRAEQTRSERAIQVLCEHGLDEFADEIRSTKNDIGPIEVYSSNITGNIFAMAKEAGISEILWKPHGAGITKAKQLIEPLAAGLSLLWADPAYFKQFNPKNGWGSYDSFVQWCSEYLTACINNPEADVSVY